MTAPLRTVSHRTRLHKLEEMFLGLFLRHLLVEKEGEYIGLISIGDVLRANLLEKDEKFKEYGMNDYVLKPFEPEDLFQKIAKYVKR